MLDSLRRPLPAYSVLAGSVAVSVAVAVYCLAYTALAGREESAIRAVCWAIANVLPWLFAIEAGKRAGTAAEAAGCVFVALIASLALGYLLAASAGDLGFEAVRRIPALAASAIAIALLRSGIGRPARAGRELPLLPRQIDWVCAAGNYVELRAGSKTVIHRSPIGAVESQLVSHGFVRIHRSLLVRRDRIAKVRPLDIILDDGTHLRVGKKYRATLTA